MSSRDDDILDFDFVDEDDEGATREAQRRDEPAPPSRSGGGGDGPRGPRRPSLPERPGGWTPLLRLVGVVALAILVVILLVVLVQGCSSNQKRDSYSSYMTAIGGVGSSSAKIGVSLSELLTTPGLKQTALETKLTGLIQQQKLGLSDAEALDPPGPVHAANENALRALQLRVNGMQALLATFKATKTSDSASEAGTQLAADAKRLTASDVVWADLFQALAKPGARIRGSDGRHRARERLRDERRALQRELDECRLAARPRRVDRRNAVGAARDEHHGRYRATGGRGQPVAPALAVDGDDDPGLDGARVRGIRAEQR